MCGDYERDDLLELQANLQGNGVDSYIAGLDGNSSTFRKAGHVTISNIFRAKGNEAWKVYACRFHYATLPLEWKQENELHKRNEAFVALTRARVWCVATGIDSPIFDELQQAVNQYPKFTFPAFNKGSLKRLTARRVRVAIALVSKRKTDYFAGRKTRELIRSLSLPRILQTLN